MRTAILLTLATAAMIAVPFAASADPNLKKGEAIYQERCTLCHSADGSGQGPNLNGVVGRKAASLPGFAYTDALKSSGLTWTPDVLSKFLTDPMAMVPGTAMPMAVPDADERADLIAYLASQK